MFSYFFFKEKFCISARVGKSLAWTVFTFRRKMFCLLCLLYEDGIVQVSISPVLVDRKQYFFIHQQNTLAFNKNAVS